MLNYSLKKTDLNSMLVTWNIKNSGLEQWVLVRSDVHHDNPKCDQELELKHLKEAKERNAVIIDTGDLFCAMQGKYDKRSNKNDIRPENQGGDYLDSLVRSAADFYEPYAKNFICLGYGNHETAILNRHETDLTQRLAATLNDRTGSNIMALGYTGWIRFRFKVSKSSINKTLWYTHGYGGGGPVTEDMIQSSRQRVFIHADIMASGHVHRSWTQEYVTQELSYLGEVTTKQGVYIKIPSYKDSYGKGRGGFEVEKGMGPRPKGAYWIRFYGDDITRKGVNFDVIKAN